MLGVLQPKHPDAREPSSAILDAYLGPPTKMVQMYLIVDTIMDVEQNLSGGAYPGGEGLLDPPQMSLTLW